MSSKSSWFTVRLSLLGISEKEDPNAVQYLQEELNMRPHLRSPQVFWEAETHRAIIQADTEGLEAKSVAKQLAEELFEVACAVLSKVEGMHVNILDVHPSPY